MAEKHPQYINSIARALEVLELYEKTGETWLGIADITAALGIQKTSTFNIVKTLTACGWLIQETQNGKYRLGTRILRVSTAAAKSLSVSEVITMEMRRIRELFNEDVVLTAIIDGQPVCVEKVQSENSLRIASIVGRIGNFLRGSTGKTLFAWQPMDFIIAYLDAEIPDTAEGRERKEEMLKTVEEIREAGYSISISEQDPGVASVTAPILGKNGYARYSLGVVGEENRMERKQFRTKIRDEIMQSARRVEEANQFLN